MSGRHGRLRAWWRRAVLAALAVGLATPVVLGTFVATRCYAPVRTPNRPAADGSLPAGYRRPEAFTYLTLPEWYVVFSTEEYAHWIRSAPPSDFPYLGAVGQYWSVYAAACDATRGVYPFETRYHAKLSVTGASFTVEYALKGAYENTIGRASLWLFGTDTPEDRFATTVARDYGAFMHVAPWYAFPFAARLRALWFDLPLWGPHAGRKWERRAALTAELGAKAVSGALMGLASRAAFGAGQDVTFARMANASDRTLAEAGGQVESRTRTDVVGRLPRYEAFTAAALALVARGGRFVDIAGNDEIVVTVLAPRGAGVASEVGARVVARLPLVTRPDTVRLALAVAVARLHDVMQRTGARGLVVEHVYDY